jgi:hypothetical protein
MSSPSMTMMRKVRLTGWRILNRLKEQAKVARTTPVSLAEDQHRLSINNIGYQIPEPPKYRLGRKMTRSGRFGMNKSYQAYSLNGHLGTN